MGINSVSAPRIGLDESSSTKRPSSCDVCDIPEGGGGGEIMFPLSSGNFAPGGTVLYDVTDKDDLYSTLYLRSAAWVKTQVLKESSAAMEEHEANYLYLSIRKYSSSVLRPHRGTCGELPPRWTRRSC